MRLPLLSRRRVPVIAALVAVALIAALAERLRTLTEAGGCAVLAHAPGADLSDVLPAAHLTLHLQGELSHA